MLPENYQQVDPSYVLLERIYGAIILLIAIVAAGIPFFVIDEGYPTEIVGGVFFVLALVLFHIPARRYRHYGFRLSDNGLWIRRGMFFHTETYIPRDRLQHTDVKQGPFERMLNLSTLVIYTAGVEGAMIDVPGLTRTIAIELRDELNHEIKEGNL